MATMSKQMVAAYFAAKDVTVNDVAEDIIICGWGFEGGTIKIFFDFDDDEHVHIFGLDFISVPADKYDGMYKVLNGLNDTYKHVKFVLDTDKGMIKAMDDAIISVDSCGEECFELMIRMIQIVEDAYPTIMKAIWA